MPIKLRHLHLAAVAILGVSLLGVVTADAHASQHSCRPRHSITVAATPAIRVYREPGRHTVYVYACRYASGRTTRLGEHISDGEFDALLISDVHIAGDYVGFIRQTVTRDSAAAEGRVVDTRTGHVIRHVHRGYVDQNELAWPSDAVVTKRGTAAFMFVVTNRDYANRRQVVQIADGPDPGGSRIVAEGAEIKPQSLELHGGLVTWCRVVSTPIA